MRNKIPADLCKLIKPNGYYVYHQDKHISEFSQHRIYILYVSQCSKITVEFIRNTIRLNLIENAFFLGRKCIGLYSLSVGKVPEIEESFGKSARKSVREGSWTFIFFYLVQKVVRKKNEFLHENVADR
jgi:hypothetical protein